MMTATPTIIIYIIICEWPLLHAVPEVGSYCENEVMRASCGPDEVVVMTNATYGRMEQSRCIDRNYGYLGCKVDVLEDADRKCSGKRSCEIRVPNPEFSDSNACPRDLKPYLQAQYACVKVMQPRQTQCSPRTSISLSAPQGVIASVVTMDTGLGVAECPWVLEAPPGQRINFTLHDFGRSRGTSEVCHAYAILRETSPEQRLTVCNGRERLRHVYTSLSNTVEIRVLGSNKGRHFLLQYQMTGCADITGPGTWFRRAENPNRAKAGCSGSESSRELRCVGTEWQGRMENCSQVRLGSVMQHEVFGLSSWPFGFSVAMIILIALVIGVVFMGFGLMCLRWRRKSCFQSPSNATPDSYYSYITPGSKSLDSRRYVKRELPWPPIEPDALSYAEENEYSYITDLPPPPANHRQDYMDSPNYFELESEQTNPALIGQNGHSRYVSGVHNQPDVTAPSRRKESYGTARHSSCRQAGGNDFMYPYSAGNNYNTSNHISV